MDVRIEASWKEVLSDEFKEEYFAKLKQFLLEEKSNYTIYPKSKYIFEAFNRTSFNNTKVIILGQDPYHGPGQAHGLSFSVPKDIKQPPSLKNILKEIYEDIGIKKTLNGDLSKWADNGVLLLNATLTVRAGQAGSHQNKGWEIFTDAVIKKISELKENCVFILWGNYAQNKEKLINKNKHLILKSVHPSPLSAHRGFLGCKHFSLTNDYLIKNKIKPIDWNLSE